ncbi:MAG: cytochrome d ubiquinol oxidase subunit II [Acidobacteria bacterium]|nr:cytochrome d ubiquinol oxidase subunit II [Acidobacteriota bacterium]
MEALWFCLIALMITTYVVLDGLDLGAGIVHLGVARSEAERREALGAVGPVWDGNEIWLAAAVGAVYAAFPTARLSGFHLPLIAVLGLLIARWIAIGLRRHVTIMGSSALLAILLGATLGNVMRGVPLDFSGQFILPLWTGFFNWYSLLVGLLAGFTLTVHGALWLAGRTGGEVAKRSLRAARLGWWAVALLTFVATACTLRVQLQLWANLEAQRWGFVFPALALGGLAAVRYWVVRGAAPRAFLASCAYIAGMLGSAAFGLFPNVLPSSTGLGPALTVYSTAASGGLLKAGLLWWIPGMMLAAGYSVYMHRARTCTPGA